MKKILQVLITLLVILSTIRFSFNILKRKSFESDIGCDSTTVEVIKKYSNGSDNLWIISPDEYFRNNLIEKHQLLQNDYDFIKYKIIVSGISKNKFNLENSGYTSYANITSYGQIIYMHNKNYSLVIVIRA